MKAASVIITWTPNRAPYEKYSTRGVLEVTPFPEQSAQTHPMAVGACSAEWINTDEHGRRHLMQRYVTVMLHQDHLPVEMVREQISRIDEYRNFPFSTADTQPVDVGEN